MATMDDCCRIADLLHMPPGSTMPLMIGYLEILSTVELKVTAIYTATSLESKTLSIDVEQIQPIMITP